MNQNILEALNKIMSQSEIDQLPQYLKDQILASPEGIVGHKGYLRRSHIFRLFRRALSPGEYMVLDFLWDSAWGCSNPTGVTRKSLTKIEEGTSLGLTAIKVAVRQLQVKGLIHPKEISHKLGILWEVPSFLVDEAMLNKTLSDRVDSQPSQNPTGSESESAALVGRNPATYKDSDKELFLENTLKAYFLHLAPLRRREREVGYFNALKREFSVEDIGECLVWLQRFGIPGTGEPCYSPMGFLMHAMGDVLRAVRAAKAKRVQAEQDELAKTVEAARNAEAEKLEAEEFERKAAKFLHVFPDARSQEDIVAEYCKNNQWVPKGNVARRLAIQEWWDRVYGSENAQNSAEAAC